MAYGELTAGKEIDAKCTRCKIVIGHTIVAMVGTEPRRVKCNSCGSEHRYIPAPDTQTQVTRTTVRVRREEGRRKEIRVDVVSPHPAGEKAGRERTSGRTRSGSGKAPPRSAPSFADEYHELIRDKEPAEPREYSAKETFQENDLVDHKAFGRGIVVRVRGTKIEVHFRDAGPKVLVHRAAP
jgi:hypothetical protein